MTKTQNRTVWVIGNSNLEFVCDLGFGDWKFKLYTPYAA